MKRLLFVSIFTVLFAFQAVAQEKQNCAEHLAWLNGDSLSFDRFSNIAENPTLLVHFEFNDSAGIVYARVYKSKEFKMGGQVKVNAAPARGYSGNMFQLVEEREISSTEFEQYMKGQILTLSDGTQITLEAQTR